MEEGGGRDVEVPVSAEVKKTAATANIWCGAGGMKVERLALPLGMVMVQVFTVVTMVLSKVALNTGMHPLVLLVYRNLIGAAAVAPLAVVFEWYAGAELHLGQLEL